jgi:hypothetical protein
MVMVMDSCLTHRTRGLEGKHGNPLNEVRILCNSLMLNHGIVSADKTTKSDPAKSILKYRVGDEIGVDEDGFRASSRPASLSSRAGSPAAPRAAEADAGSKASEKPAGGC